MPTMYRPSSARVSGMREPDGPLTDEEIVTALSHRIDEALNRPDSKVSGIRKRLLERYDGEPLGEEEEGRSTFNTREVYELVEEALPSLLSVFFSAKTPVAFAARSEADVEAAAQETDVIDHYLFRRENSFLTFHELFKSALLDPVAYCKVHCVMAERTRHHNYAELTAQQFVELTGGESREWAGEEEISESVDPKTGELRFSFKGTEIVREPEMHIEALPPEQVLVDRNARYLDLDKVWDDYGFLCHETEVAFTELVQRGYDPDLINEAGSINTRAHYNSERVSRRDAADEQPYLQSAGDYSTRRFTVRECYVKMDCDGTGLAEGWRIVLVGDTILERSKVSYQPLVAVSLVPMPFTHIGRSPAQMIEDLQHLKTKLVRTLLNNLYDNESKTSFIDKQALNARSREQMSDPQARFIELEGSPSQAVRPLDVASIGPEVMASLGYADDLVKRRTGMAPDNALNPDVLRDATAHGMLASMDKQSSRLMSFARLLAETCVKKIGVKLHQLMRMYQDRSLVLQLRDRWVHFDPSDWAERTTMRVAVGLGFNSKEQRVAALMQVLGLQKEALGQGLAEPKHLKHTLEQMIEFSDLGFYGQFFVDPTAPGWKPPPPKPDPQMEAVKAQAQIAQAQEQTKQAEIQSLAQQAQQKSAIEMRKVDVDEKRIDADAKLKRTKALMESTFLVELKRLEAEKLKAEIEKLKAEASRLGANVAEAAANIDKTRTETAKLRAEPAEGSEEEVNDEGQEE